MTSREADRQSDGRRAKGVCLSLLLILFFGFARMPARAQEGEAPVSFEIERFEVSGNTVLSENEVRNALQAYTGPGRTAADVEAARDSLETLYHEKGYPTVLVNIPQQTIEAGLVVLAVIESRVRYVKVTDNRYFTREKIMAEAPSLWPGRILYVPEVRDDLARLNQNADFSVTPVLKPARELGFIDVELRVEDHLPLHASLELNNRNTHTTSDLRLNGMIRYDNLWQKEHSVSVQYQASPEETEEVKVLAVSYMLPAPWKDEHLIALYGVSSDSQSAFGEGFKVTGKGKIAGARYVIPLPVGGQYSHSLTLGGDYKDFDETLGFATEGEEPQETPVTYLPFSLAYSGFHLGGSGVTRVDCAFNMAFRGLVTDPDEFAIKRYQARGSYGVVTLGLERKQKLPAGFALSLGVDGQAASEPLISSEQYAAGGMESVRGYKESEIMGDNAVRATANLALPELLQFLGAGKRFQFMPYLFYDYARVLVKSPLPGQPDRFEIQGTGIGVQGQLTGHISYRVDAARALDDTDQVKKGDDEIHFRVKSQF